MLLNPGNTRSILKIKINKNRILKEQDKNILPDIF
jgi:hypothetical protein